MAALYTRNLVTLRALGIGKYFWFSAQTSPTYGWAVFYENYIPRPRLAALNACASFLEGAAYRRSFAPGKNALVHLFEGDAPVCVAWNMNSPARLLLPRPIESLRAFDLMGNEVRLAGGDHGVEVSLAAERPIYLRCREGDRAALEEALAAAKMIDLDAVAVAARPVAGGMQVTLTGRARTAQDGVVEVLPSAAAAPAGWPAPSTSTRWPRGRAAPRTSRCRSTRRPARSASASATGTCKKFVPHAPAAKDRRINNCRGWGGMPKPLRRGAGMSGSPGQSWADWCG